MWTPVQKLLKLSGDAGKKFQAQQGRALVECECLRLAFGMGLSKEKIYVLYKIPVIYLPNLFTHWELPVWKDWRLNTYQN